MPIVVAITSAIWTNLLITSVYINNVFYMLFVYLTVGTVNGGMSTERETIRNDMEAARTLLKQMEEQFNKLEAKVSQLPFHH